MKEKRYFFSLLSDGRKTNGELVYKRHFLIGILLCAGGAAVTVWAFHIGLLKLLGIAVFLAANALFLAGVYQLLGVAEIPCPVCGKMMGVPRLQKECKCRNCGKKFRINVEKR